MRRWMAVVAAVLLFAFPLTGCGSIDLQDGVYTAEFAEYDSRGYKDYIVVTVEGGAVVSLEFNGQDEEGNLKTEDNSYAVSMQAVQYNNPTQVVSTLINQYLASGSVEGIDVVAGATYSTDSFIALFKALQTNMEKGDTTARIVENVPEK